MANNSQGNRPHICVIIYKVAVVALMIDICIALWNIANNIAALKH